MNYDSEAKDIAEVVSKKLTLRQEFATMVLHWAVMPGHRQWFEDGFDNPYGIGRPIEGQYTAWLEDRLVDARRVNDGMKKTVADLTSAMRRVLVEKENL